MLRLVDDDIISGAKYIAVLYRGQLQQKIQHKMPLGRTSLALFVDELVKGAERIHHARAAIEEILAKRHDGNAFALTTEQRNANAKQTIQKTTCAKSQMRQLRNRT